MDKYTYIVTSLKEANVIYACTQEKLRVCLTKSFLQSNFYCISCCVYGSKIRCPACAVALLAHFSRYVPFNSECFIWYLYTSSISNHYFLLCCKGHFSCPWAAYSFLYACVVNGTYYCSLIHICLRMVESVYSRGTQNTLTFSMHINVLYHWIQQFHFSGINYL